MARITIALLLFISITKPGEAATASAASGGTFAAPSSTTPGTASWSWFDPDTFDRITWKSGTNHADATPFTHTDVDELYFRFTIPPPPAPPVQVISGKPTFTGFTYSDGPGGAGSVATTSGTGASTYGKRKVAATWSVTATGSLGLSAPPIPSWDSMCSGNDPFTVMSSSLSGFTGGYSLFFVTGLSSASFSSRGSTDLNVSYKTASSNLDLLDIHLSPTGAAVTGSSPAGLTIYSAPSVDVDPDTFTGTPLTLAQIQSALQSDLSGNTLGSPHYFAFLLNGLPIPTTDMGGGVVAEVHSNATASDSAVGVPEPASWILLSAGIGGLASRRRSKRTTR